MWKPNVVLIAVFLFVTGVSVQPTLGADYPSKIIEMLSPYAPGGSMDVVSRLVAEHSPKYLGQRMVVVNKPGGSGSLAAAEVISSKPDGYKLITLANLFFASTIKTQEVPFEQTDLVPIANFVEYKLGMMVKGDSPWKTFGDLIDYAKKNPGKLRWNHPGRGTSLHMDALLVFRKAGVETIEIPNPKGAADSTGALLGGHVDAAAMPYGAAKDLMKAGRVRFLIFYTDHRYADPPDVPCSSELGYPEAAKLNTYIGVYAHKNTPKDVQKTLFDAFQKTHDDPQFKKGIETLAEEPRFGGPEFMRDSIKKCEEVCVPLLKEFGLYVGK